MRDLHSLCKLVIGLDCGRHTGFALFSLEKKKFIQLKTFEPHQLLLYLTTNAFFTKSLSSLMFVVENANFNKVVFPARFNNPYLPKSGAKRDGGIGKMGLNIGRNLEATYVTINFLIERGYNVEQIKPTTKKWSQEVLSQKFPYLTVSNEHTRDAVKLVSQFLNLDSDKLLF